METKASTLLEFLAGLGGSLFVTFEEGTWAAWLYDLLKPHVTEVLVCNRDFSPTAIRLGLVWLLAGRTKGLAQLGSIL